jgi:hypothetical protein
VRWTEEVDEDSGHTISGGDTYEMLRCRGCGNITLRHSSWFSEEADERGKPLVGVKYYPPATSRQKPEWLLLLSLNSEAEFAAELLEEVYVALQSGQTRLAAMGIRAMLEHVMIAKVGDKGSFARNLDAFQDAGFVSHVQKRTLDATLELGHAVMHRTHNPTSTELITLIDITEGLIEAIYILPDRMDKVSQRVPPRRKHQKSGAERSSPDDV